MARPNCLYVDFSSMCKSSLIFTCQRPLLRYGRLARDPAVWGSCDRQCDASRGSDAIPRLRLCDTRTLSFFQPHDSDLTSCDYIASNRHILHTRSLLRTAIAHVIPHTRSRCTEAYPKRSSTFAQDNNTTTNFRSQWTDYTRSKQRSIRLSSTQSTTISFH
jgi:hypothetical protein